MPAAASRRGPANEKEPEDRPGGNELQLPPPLEGWAVTVAVWPELNASSYRLVARTFAEGRAPDWAFFTSILTQAAIVEPGSSTDTYLLTPQWRGRLERELDAFGGEADVRSRLMEQWADKPDSHVMGEIAGWAAEAERWDILEQVWLHLHQITSRISRQALRVLADIPAEARKERPLLTWASGAAASILSTREHGIDPLWERLLLDSALVHADWAQRADSDEAVTAGTFRMIGQRHLPSGPGHPPLDDAWRTKEEIDAFIDARSRAGAPPGRVAQATFRAFSARLALFKRDPLAAMGEARWSEILSDWGPSSALAQGVGSLAASLASEEGPAHFSDPPVGDLGDALGARGLRGQGRVFEMLADGHEAVRRLDRAGLERCLSLVSEDLASATGVWAVRAALDAWHALLWGDPVAGLEEMSAVTQRFAMPAREQDEPLGRAQLGRVRVVLLAKAGALAAAARLASALPDEVGLISRARVHLWAGQYADAILLTDSGRFQPGLSMTDRYRLTLIRAAAALLAGNLSDAFRNDGIRELTRLLASESYVNMALLPPAARVGLLAECAAELDRESVRRLADKLNELNDVGDDSLRPVHLTERERVLLPMLAEEISVPEIAQRLQVSVNTVRKQVVTLREKFQVGSRDELVRKARARGALS